MRTLNLKECIFTITYLVSTITCLATSVLTYVFIYHRTAEQAVNNPMSLRPGEHQESIISALSRTTHLGSDVVDNIPRPNN
jgi:heme/copper-type cytochrome/quinol oxidase subunit 2